MSGYTALRESAAWFDVSQRGRLRATGEDRLRLLHAMASNAVEHLKPGEGTRAFFLDVHGHILADTRIWVFADSALIDTEPETRQVLLSHLEKYIIMDDVALDDVTDSTALIALEGPQANSIVQQEIGSTPEQEQAHTTSGGITVVRTSATGQPGYWLLIDRDGKDDLVRRLEAAGVNAASADDVRTVRVENGVPRHSEDYFEKTLPQESEQMDRISFSKGCYLGQEIVERVRARGEVKRSLIRLQIDTTEPPPADSPLLSDGREIGKLTSPVFSPGQGICFGFSIARRDSVGPDHELSVAGHRAHVTAVQDTP